MNKKRRRIGLFVNKRMLLTTTKESVVATVLAIRQQLFEMISIKYYKLQECLREVVE